ncbi:MAG: HD domain-containing protein [Archaeoglobales archaeon]|nr:HD domain-containing protein [Archaeoglobales archaeon]
MQRVVKLAKLIAEREGANLEIVLKSAELHDCARDKDNHAIESAKLAREILKSQGCSEDFVEAVAHAIEAHSFSAGIMPRTLEAKVLSDADKLDALGAIGVARAFMVAGEKGRSIEETLKHFEEKLLKLKDLLYTETARKLAERRHEFLKRFYEEIRKDLEFRE